MGKSGSRFLTFVLDIITALLIAAFILGGILVEYYGVLYIRPNVLFGIGTGVVIGIGIFSILIMVVAGRECKGGELYFIDRMPIEILFVVASLLGTIPYILAEEFAYSTGLAYAWQNATTHSLVTAIEMLGRWNVAFVVMLFFVANMVLVRFCTSIVIRIRNKKFWETSLIGKIVLALMEMDSEYSGKRSKRFVFGSIGLLVVGFLMSAVEALVVLVLPIFLFFATRFSKNYLAIRNAISELAKGNLDHKIDTKKMKGEFLDVATEINSISTAQHKAIESKLRDQQLRTELITNVSHDLKTPLTSIVSYIDLLKKEDVENERAKEYIDVLEEKAGRLKELTENLFEAAKASSGSITMSLEPIKVKSIIAQSLVELEDRLEESQIAIVNEFDVESHNEDMVIADGNYLHRVMENLLTNVAKYGTPSTRLYINGSEEKSLYKITLKNISKYPLNIEGSKLLERTVRGDSSREKPGSGLGLSIAADLIRLMGGRLNIIIDGDMFKAEIILVKGLKSSDEQEDIEVVEFEDSLVQSELQETSAEITYEEDKAKNDGREDAKAVGVEEERV